MAEPEDLAPRLAAGGSAVVFGAFLARCTCVLSLRWAATGLVHRLPD